MLPTVSQEVVIAVRSIIKHNCLDVVISGFFIITIFILEYLIKFINNHKQ